MSCYTPCMATMGRPPVPASERLRRAIQSSKKTQFEIAIAVGVHPSAISRFVKDGSDIKLSTAERLFDLFDLRVVPASKVKG